MANGANGAAKRDSQQSTVEIWKPVPVSRGVLAVVSDVYCKRQVTLRCPMGGYRAYLPEPRFGQVSKARKTRTLTCTLC